MCYQEKQLSIINGPAEQSENQSHIKSSHQFVSHASWWLDFYSMAGRKSENQDSLIITTCLTGYLPKASKQNEIRDNVRDNSSLIAPLNKSANQYNVDSRITDNYPRKRGNLNHETNINQCYHSLTDKSPADNIQKAIDSSKLPVLAVLSDGVSACQFPKQASQIAVEITVEAIIEGLQKLQQQSVIEPSHFGKDAYKVILDDDSVAGIIKSALIKANDSMYFSQAYQRVPPLLATMSGVLCIGDRVHLFHTGDSRIYRVGADNLTVLTEDHRIHHGQDKGALSAAIGADSRLDLQQMVFTLHQNEYLALMTDGVYEFIDPVEMQFEFSAAVSHLENTPDWNQLTHWQLSRHLCHIALTEGSNDNLSMIMIGMGAPPSPNTESKAQLKINSEKTVTSNKPNNLTVFTNKSDLTVLKDKDKSNISDDIDGLMLTQSRQMDADKHNDTRNEHDNDGLSDDKYSSVQLDRSTTLSNDRSLNDREARLFSDSTIAPTRYQLPTGLEVGDQVDGLIVDSIIARTARSEVYLVHDNVGNQYALKSPSLMTVDDGHYLRDFLKERKIGLSLSKHRRAGEVAYNQANPNQSPKSSENNTQVPVGSGLSESGLLRYYPVPASSTYLYHLTEYIEGESLRAFMERNGPCDVWQTYDLLTKIGMAVRVMHRNYLLHQDIKPENILLTKSGAVKLIDFGSVASSIIRDNTRPPVGDLHYAAPEYYTDAPKGVSSDLFSIAVIGFELLTGERPFASRRLMSAHDALIVPTDLLQRKRVPATSQQALLRALHRNTNARHQAIGEFLQDFNPDNSASLSDPQPLIKRNPLLVWHGICLIQSIIIILLLIKYLPTS